MDKKILEDRVAILEPAIQQLQGIIQQNTAQLNAYIGALSELKELISKCNVKEGELLEPVA